MCGIVGYTGSSQAGPILLDGLRRLEYRGYDSAGVAVREENAAHIEVVKASGRLDHLAAMTDSGMAIPGCCGVGHTRWATHGEPSEINAHPHYSREKRVVLVHNGIIENYQEIRDMLQRRGYRFTTQTDTEAACLLLDYYYTQQRGGMQLKERALLAIRDMMVRIEGSCAMGILFYDQPGVIYAVRKDSPLIVGRCSGKADGYILASDVPAVLAYTRSVVYIDNMEIVRLTKDELNIYDIDGEEMDKPFVQIQWDAQAAEKGGYAHFMMKEMREQPIAVRDTIMPRIKEMADGLVVDLSETGFSRADWQRFSRVLFVGCGSAYHAGMTAMHVTERLTGLPCSTELASELRYRNAPVEENTLCVVISQSGETADSLAALRLCMGKGMKTLAIVNVVGSSIAREAGAVLYTHAGPEIAVATTKAYAAQLAALYLLAMCLADAQGKLEKETLRALTSSLLSLPEQIERAFADAPRIQWFASQYVSSRDVFFVGRGLDYALCMEGSLKLKEISYIHSEAYAAGELKHGAISLIEEGMLVVGAATQPPLMKKMISGLCETRARGAYVFAVTIEESAQEMRQAADFIVSVQAGEPLFAASVAVVPLQMLAYYIACERGLDVDKPRNLAKSVTVE